MKWENSETWLQVYAFPYQNFQKKERKKGEENLKLFSPDEYSEICKNIYLRSIS